MYNLTNTWSDAPPTSPNLIIICDSIIYDACTTLYLKALASYLSVIQWCLLKCERWGGEKVFIRERNLKPRGTAVSAGQAQARSTWRSRNRSGPAIRLSLYRRGWSSKLSHNCASHFKALWWVEGVTEHWDDLWRGEYRQHAHILRAIVRTPPKMQWFSYWDDSICYTPFLKLTSIWHFTVNGRHYSIFNPLVFLV